ncbi:apolipoprotein D-like [Bactrocera neohumeralis]|uniref:apolipoprotein D-like n=1 Tax=Bactrocera neohumeralis TaxID=98809 RepID=UPI0021658704|nr:apolipoprotein D-like [Bactrocera neohumeralis]
MQKTILAIVALALFGIAQAQVQFSGACPCNVQVQPDFDVAAYLGSWYEYAKYPVYFEANGKCVKAEYTLKDNGQVGVVNSMIEATTDQTSDIVGYAVVVENAKLLVTFPVSPAYNVSSNYWVLSTDYTNYSVVYSCQPTQDDSHSLVVWILTREQNPSAELIAKAKDVLTSNGVSLSPLVVTDQSGCQAAAADGDGCA